MCRKSLAAGLFMNSAELLHSGDFVTVTIALEQFFLQLLLVFFKCYLRIIMNVNMFKCNCVITLAYNK
jgi:hypothetical protein